MTVLDLIGNLPVWAKVLAYLILFVWAFEMFLLPFKFNIRNNRLGEFIKLQNEVLSVIEQKNKNLEETYLMLSTIMGSMLKKEQEGSKKV